MKRVVIVLVAELFTFFWISFLRVPYTERMAEIMYGICGVLFSVAMSQVMAFDLSKIAEKNVYSNMVDSLKKVKTAFFIQFLLASISFVFFQAFKTKEFLLQEICIKGRRFSAELFCILVILFSLFFLSYNFYLLSNKKAKLDRIIREESLED